MYNVMYPPHLTMPPRGAWSTPPFVSQLGKMSRAPQTLWDSSMGVVLFHTEVMWVENTN